MFNMLEPAEITYQKRIGMMLQNLEDEGFNLYFDEKSANGNVWEKILNIQCQGRINIK